jgi:hypothetical protein
VWDDIQKSKFMTIKKKQILKTNKQPKWREKPVFFLHQCHCGSITKAELSFSPIIQFFS